MTDQKDITDIADQISKYISKAIEDGISDWIAAAQKEWMGPAKNIDFRKLLEAERIRRVETEQERDALRIENTEQRKWINVLEEKARSDAKELQAYESVVEAARNLNKYHGPSEEMFGLNLRYELDDAIAALDKLTGEE